MVEKVAAEKIYEKLRVYLDGLPGGYPSTESGKDIESLKWMFTPEEAEVEVHLRLAPEPASAIAKRCGKSEAETKRILDTMVRDGLIFPVKSGKENLYMALQFMTGFSENLMSHRMDPETAKLGLEYFEESGYLEDFARQKQMRVVPVSEAVEVTAAVATYDNIREIIRQQDVISVTPCPCRVLNAHLGKTCEHPIESELIFGTIAQYRIDNGFGRRISVEDALKIIDEAEEKAMVVAPVNTQEAIGMCLCGGCCCHWLRGLKMLERPADHVQSSYQARIDPEKCNACGTCIERCQMEAIVEREDVMEVDLARCIGCGLCLPTCTEDAVSLVAREDMPAPSPTYMGLVARVAGDRGLPMGKYEKLMNKSSLDGVIKQFKILHKLHIDGPVVNQMAKRGMV
ncbi:MAG: 4Fe-4S binding protein [Actinobacteria bacterium]|nr:4Fe-4S binding protein [Actinomycetota bacterium]